MEEFKNFLLSLFGIGIAMGTSILVMIHGWGLSPKSWWWIIGMYLIGHIFAVFLIYTSKK